MSLERISVENRLPEKQEDDASRCVIVWFLFSDGTEFWRQAFYDYYLEEWQLTCAMGGRRVDGTVTHWSDVGGDE